MKNNQIAFLLGIFLGVLLMLSISLFLFEKRIKKIESIELEAMKMKVGEYYINKETNEKEFRFINCKEK